MPSTIQYIILAAYIVGGFCCGKKLLRRLHNRIEGRECHKRTAGREFR